MMLKSFDKWPDVLEHVRAGGVLYYVYDNNQGPYRTIASIVPEASAEPTRLRLRSPAQQETCSYPTTIADKSFLDKLYRWEVRKAIPH